MFYRLSSLLTRISATMSFENMTTEEAILGHAKTALKLAAYKNAQFLAYAEFCEGIFEDYQIDVTKVAKDNGYSYGPDYLRFLGLNLNENGDLIVSSSEKSTVTSEFIAAKTAQQQKEEKIKFYKQQPFVPLINYQPSAAVGDGLPKSINDVLIFDGDESKLLPGMRVKIATGVIHTLPSIPNDPKLQPKACRNHRKKVKEIVALDAKMRAVYAKMRGNKE